jgi:hypothetical protein
MSKELIQKLLREQLEGTVKTGKRNFIVGDSAYITGDLYNLEINPVSSVGKPNWFQVRAEIPLRDFYKPDAVIGSFMKFVYNSDTGKAWLAYNYNFTGWKDFFEVTDPKFHPSFKKMLNDLTQMAEQMVAEKSQ